LHNINENKREFCTITFVYLSLKERIMELTFFALAFACGFVVLQLRLPPLIGFLAAGFLLNGFGYQSTDLLQTTSDLGITLLLFSIGLKLKVEQLAIPQVWAVSSMHIILSSALFTSFLILLAYLQIPLFAELTSSTALLLGFAFSFSSTVFAIKVLESRGELGSLHGKISIGILVMQDIFAVVFLTASTAALPSAWALLLLLLPFARKPLFWLLERAQHGEVLPLFGGFFALIAGYALFDGLGVKGDLGALIVGMLFASHPKAKELAKSLLSFKDFLLIGFFLTIGLNAHISFDAFMVAMFFVLVLPLKVMIYYWTMTVFKLRARTSIIGSFTLSNYSEFGLILCALAATNGWLSGEWLAVFAIAVSTTFIIATPLNKFANEIYVKYEKSFSKFELNTRLDMEKEMSLGETKVLIFGMGRIGAGVYDELIVDGVLDISGVDSSPEVIAKQARKNRNVILADATDPDFWQRINHSDVKMVMLAMPKHMQNVFAVKQLKSSGYTGKVTAIAFYKDQQHELKAMGVDSTYNFYKEAGTGFAEHAKDLIEPS
jgi:predicted Kef-type K+ transport protein